MYVDLPVLAGVAALVVVVLTAAAAQAAWPRRTTGPARRSVVAVWAYKIGLPVPAVMGVRLALEPGAVRPALGGIVIGTAGVLAALTFQAGAAGADAARLGQTFELWAMSGFDGRQTIPAGLPRQWAADPDVVSVTDTRVGVATIGSTPVTVFTRAPVGGRPLRLVATRGRPPSHPGEIAARPGRRPHDRRRRRRPGAPPPPAARWT